MKLIFRKSLTPNNIVPTITYPKNQNTMLPRHSVLLHQMVLQVLCHD